MRKRIADVDISETDYKRAEAQYKTIIQTSMDGFWLIDIQGNFLDVNDAYCRLIGYNRDELLTMKIQDVEAAETYEETIQHIKKIKEKGHDRFETSHRHKNGKLVYLEVSSNYIDTGGGRFFVFLRDITERKKVEEALQKAHQELEEKVRERSAELSKANEELMVKITAHESTQRELQISETKCRQIFDNMSNGVAVYEAVSNGEDFIIRDFNKGAEKIEKISKGDVIGKSVLEIFPGVKEFGLFEVFQRVWKTGNPEYFPVRFYKDQRISGWKENYVYKLPSGEVIAIYDDVTERKKAEEALKEREKELQIEARNLEEANVALKVLLKRRDEDKAELEDKVLLNTKGLVTPYLEKLKMSGLDKSQKDYLTILESSLNQLISPFLYRLSSNFANFTPTEIQVANLLKQGKTSKEIGELLNSSSRTIAFHRNNIRKKLGLKNKKTNLKSYLLSLR